MKKEDLITLYKRVEQVAITQSGSSPDEIHLDEDGNFKVVYGNTCRGEYYEDDFHIIFEDLDEDLDKLVAERLEKERLEEQKRKEEREENQRRENKRKEIEERAELERLKKKYE